MYFYIQKNKYLYQNVFFIIIKYCYWKKSAAFNLVRLATLICSRLSVRLLSSVAGVLPLLGVGVRGVLALTTFGVVTSGRLCVGVPFGVACDKMPISLGVSLSRGETKCFAANFLAAGDILARRSVFDLKLIKL